MVFASTFFLFLFLPVALAGILAAPRRYRNVSLLFFSCVFYGWFENWWILLLFAVSLSDYVFGLIIARGVGTRGPIEPLEKEGKRTRLQKAALLGSILSNLGILGFFKYTGFGIKNYNAFVGLAGLPGLQLNLPFQILLPLGISFYTFQSMSYTFDVYLGNTRATRNVLDYMAFVLMFPQLVAGPIVRYRDVAQQLVDRTITREKFAYGVRRFVVGLAKKVLIANSLAVPVNAIFDIPFSQMTPGLAWLGAFGFALQIYYDFSGYSDMAIGLGSMIGFHFKENFRYPFVSASGTEYFQRWHISLNTWLRDYPYRAMGGSRGSPFRVYFNVIILLVMVGLWHGASWNFVTWGLVCGLMLAVQRYMIRNNLRTPLPYPIRAAFCFFLFMTSIVFFRSDSLSQAFVFIKGMWGFVPGDGTVYNARLYLDSKIVLCLIVGAIGSLPVVPWVEEQFSRLRPKMESWRGVFFEASFRGGRVACVAALFLASAMVLAAEGHRAFLYFRF